MRDQFYGALPEQTPEKTYQICGGYLSLPVARHNFAGNFIQYNQVEVSSMSCTVHGPMGAVSDLTGARYSLDERKAIWAAAKLKGATDTDGWFISRAVDLVRDTWNKKRVDQLATFQVELGSSEFEAMIGKGYSIVIGYSGNFNYDVDHKDGILDGTSFGATTYGHCLRMTYKDATTYNLIVDNYFTGDLKTNVYELPKANLPALITNKVFFKQGYVFVYLSDYNNFSTMAEVSAWAQNSVAKANTKGLDTNQPKKNMTIEEIESYLVQLGVLTSKLGNITKERFMVILDRTHFI